jgi:20S proteasome alpha/beta subunit
VSSLEYQDIINYDFPYVRKNESRENIYPCLSEPQLMTVVIGAKCSDGIVLIADRKLTRKNGEIRYHEKIFGDLEHVLIGYTGDAQMFDIFRRFTVGDVMIERDGSKRYDLNNLLSKISKSTRMFNELVDFRPFKVLMVSHYEKPLELYHIDEFGKHEKVSQGYKAIGSGTEITDMFCEGLDYANMKMSEFIKHAYLAIMYMNSYCPSLGVGVEPGGTPDIVYLHYNAEWDKRPTKDSPQDIEECKNYVNHKLGQFRQAFENLSKE